MLGRWSKGKTTMIAMWTLAIGIGTTDVVLTHNWGRAGLYFLGAAMCLTMSQRFAQTVGAASVAAYRKGREHNARIEQTAQIYSINSHR